MITKIHNNCLKGARPLNIMSFY